MSGLSSWLFTFVLHSTMLILVVWAATSLWFRSTREREILWRGALLGALLTATLATLTTEAGTGGLHAVTALGHTSNGFFEACGLHAAAKAAWNDRELVFYALAL